MTQLPIFLRVPSSYAQLRNGAQALSTLLAQAGAPADTASACELALQELLTNIVDHAYHEDETQEIAIYLHIEKHGQGCRLTIQTEDTGVPAQVDLKKIAMPDPLDLQEGGYGLAIISALMDEISYQRENSKNCWKLVKFFTPT